MIKRGKFERFYRDKGDMKRHYYFRLRSGNGQVICQSGAYTNEEKRDKGIRSARMNALTASTVDEKEL